MISLFETIITQTAKKYVNEVLDSGFLNQGEFVDKLEENLEKEWNLLNPVTLNSCTFALFLALKLAGISTGDEVLLPAQTFISTGLAILMVGGIPKFVDIDHNGNLSLEDLKFKKSIKSKAVMCVHWGGYPADLKPIYNYCKSSGLKLIEDAAHAFGAKYRDSIIGDCKYSDFTCFSLQSIKSLTSGDGGIICCKKQEDKELAIKLRWFGLDKKNIERGPNGNRTNNVDILGYKAHMNNLSASLALGNLEGLKERLEIKYKRAMKYNVELFGLDGITLNSANYPCRPSFWLYGLKAERRNDLIEKLLKNDIQASTVDTRIDINSIFSRSFLLNQEFFDANQLSIPNTYSMTDEDQDKIIKCIKEGW